ncbi:MAG: (d)CMP kinase [Thermoguttaceae bacterium]
MQNIITIDGPAGAGKSTVARKLAERLGWAFLDTGSMYRAVTLIAIEHGLTGNVADANKLVELARRAVIDVRDGKTFLDGNDITDRVRSPEVAACVRLAADNAGVREIMVAAQRRIAARLVNESGGVVTEGRDQGSDVFPDAKCKFFLTASPTERARRRQGELLARGVSGDEVNLDKIRRDIEERDHRDSTRAVGPLRAAPDAVWIDTDKLNIDEVVERLAAVTLSN